MRTNKSLKIVRSTQTTGPSRKDVIRYIEIARGIASALYCVMDSEKFGETAHPYSNLCVTVFELERVLEKLESLYTGAIPHRETKAYDRATLNMECLLDVLGVLKASATSKACWDGAQHFASAISHCADLMNEANRNLQLHYRENQGPDTQAA